MSAKEDLNKLISDIKFKKFQDNGGKEIVKNIEKELVEAMKPALNRLVSGVEQSVKNALGAIKIQMPDVHVPPIELPEIRVPKSDVTVNFDTSKIRLPDIKMPDEMNISGWVNFQGFDKGFLTNPLPVQLRDHKGNPVNLFENLTQIVGGGGASAKIVKVSGVLSTVGVVTIDPDGNPIYSTSVAGGGSTTVSLVNVDGAYYNSDNPLPVTGSFSSSPAPQVSGYADSVNVMQYGGVDVPTGLNETNNGVFRVVQMTDSNSSVYVTGAAASTFAEIMNPDGRVKVELPTGSSGLTDAELRASSILVEQVSGANWSVSVSGSLSSSVTVGPTVADAVDDGSAPIQIGGIARQANPTPVAANDVVKGTFDDVGRQLIRPVQVRDLTKTAYVSISNGTETTLRAAVAGAYLDLINLIGTNNSDAAITVDIRAVTGGNIQTSLRIPANGTAGASFTVPIPQDETGNNWTADLPDVTGTTVTLSALFSQEV